MTHREHLQSRGICDLRIVEPNLEHQSGPSMNVPDGSESFGRSVCSLSLIASAKLSPENPSTELKDDAADIVEDVPGQDRQCSL